MKSFVYLALVVPLCSYNVIASVINPTYEETEDDILTKDLLSEDEFERSILEDLSLLWDSNSYLLYTRQNPTTPQTIRSGSAISLMTSNYDSRKPLKVIAHGWTGSSNSLVNTMITSAFLDKSDVNVVVVDWRIRASGKYTEAAIRTPSAGRSLANFLTWLLNTGGGSWDNVHLVGFSLGAHLVGIAGREIGGLANRVTGLDPAGVLWSLNDRALNTESGQYVEVMHTNILARGITEPIGHVDFYPNGGRNQPGCLTTQCSHSRSYELFASSVRTNHFAGRECTGLWQAIFNACVGRILNMGNDNLNKSGYGIYALSTRNSWPY